ncbi:nitroreductase family protein [Calderihabitans maritimus]|uniref:Nitroreductase n=1 Tax=Calderihabitans maritimus TaxID=1246530 RepID=A0A1Z5HQ93_9FIRM|nr:nitroreductase family protein [Calderihabitans maritimus]GAW91702.1 nitroreductase [Calderihabitans maritimus]
MLQKKWYSAIKIRKSRRKFNGKPLGEKVKTKLKKFCKEFNPFSEVRACIVFKDLVHLKLPNLSKFNDDFPIKTLFYVDLLTAFGKEKAVETSW